MRDVVVTTLTPVPSLRERGYCTLRDAGISDTANKKWG